MQPERKAAWSFQLNAGIRSKRFALITDDGVVSHVAVDEGDTDMVDTSAEAILDIVTPQASALQRAGADLPPQSIALLVAAAAAAVYIYQTGDSLTTLF